MASDAASTAELPRTTPARIAIVVLVGLVALGASAMLIRHGVDRLLGIDEDVEASEVAMQVTSFGVLTWLVLLVVAGGAVTLL